MEQKKSIYRIGRYQDTGLARCLPVKEVTRINQVATKLEENIRAYRSIIQGQVCLFVKLLCGSICL